jgi:POT family proton-dependent oligopeptide transporter
MVTKLAPVRLVGFGMGGWFLSTGIGNNLSGHFRRPCSGEGGMTTLPRRCRLHLRLLGAGRFGVLLFLIAPLIQKLMHGVK